MKNLEIKKNPYIKFDWIGQGYGYKSDKLWNEMGLDDVIYVPEHGIEKDIDGNEYADIWFTKQDFIDLCNKKNCPVRADILFDMVDWQFPEALLDEIWREECD